MVTRPLINQLVTSESLRTVYTSPLQTLCFLHKGCGESFPSPTSPGAEGFSSPKQVRAARISPPTARTGISTPSTKGNFSRDKINPLSWIPSVRPAC